MVYFCLIITIIFDFTPINFIVFLNEMTSKMKKFCFFNIYYNFAIFYSLFYIISFFKNWFNKIKFEL